MPKGDAEREAIEVIRAAIQVARSAGLPVRIGDRTVRAPSDCAKSRSKVKADFEILGAADHVYVSHKDLGFSHHGYGSLGKHAVPSRSRYREPALWGFVKWARAACVEAGHFRTTGGKASQDPGSPWRGLWSEPSLRIKNLVEYGADYQEGGRQFGEYNCEFNAVGKPAYHRAADAVVLTFEGGLTRNGEPSEGGDMPVVGIMGSHTWDAGAPPSGFVRTSLSDPDEGFLGHICAMPRRAVCDPDGNPWPSGKFARMRCVAWKGDAYYADFHAGRAAFEP